MSRGIKIENISQKELKILETVVNELAFAFIDYEYDREFMSIELTLLESATDEVKERYEGRDVNVIVAGF